MAGKAIVPRVEQKALAAIDTARKAIALARETGDVATLREWRDRAAAVQHYARTRDEAGELANDAGEIKVRAERALGQIDAEANPEHRGVASPAEPTIPPVASETRAAWRRLGSLKDSQFEKVIKNLRTDDFHGVTTAGAAHLAKDFLPSRKQRQRREEPQHETEFSDDAQMICPRCHGTGRVPIKEKK